MLTILTASLLAATATLGDAPRTGTAIHAVASAGIAQTPPPAQRPNFVFILADDLGWGDLRCFGHRELRTPNLDRLASQGLRMTQFYVCSGVCSPSRTAFLTGQFPARLGIHGHLATAELNSKRAMPNWLDPAVATLPRILKQEGYATGHFGKWHLGNGPDAPDPGEYGFDVHRSVNSRRDGWEQDPYFRANSTQYFFDSTLEFIEQNRDRPFYAQAWLLLPHATLHPTPEQLEMYPQHAIDGNVPYPGSKRIYYASVTAIDQQVGRLMDRLDELGVADNTIVIFTSDNGPEDIFIRNAAHSGIGSPGPFRGRKRSLYEGGLRVPMIVRWPGVIPAGKVDDVSTVAGCDFLPTFCALAGITMPKGITVDGEDMSAVFKGRPQARTKPLLWEWRFSVYNHVWNRSPVLAIRQGRHKLLLNPDLSRVELYDIPNDPTEQNNIADQHPDLVKDMSKTVLAWQKTLPPGPLDADAGSNAYPWPKSLED